MSALDIFMSTAAAWVLMLGAIKVVACGATHECVAGPPTGRCMTCGQSVLAEVTR